MARKLSGEWIGTAAAAQALGVSPKHLREDLRLRLQVGRHYRNISPDAARPSYRWHLKRIEELLDR